MRDDVAEKRDERLAFGSLRPIELGEIVPDRPLRRIGGINRERRADRAIVIVHVPLRAVGDERRVLGGVIDDEIHHHPYTDRVRGVDEPSEQFVVAVARAAAEERVEPVVIFDGVQAAGTPEQVERVDVDPIEAHRRDPGEVLRPAVDWTDEGREQVVDARSVFHYDTPLGGWTSYPFPGCSWLLGLDARSCRWPFRLPNVLGPLQVTPTFLGFLV